MRQRLLITALATLVLTGCDKSTDPATMVGNGRAATQQAKDTVAVINGQTADVSTITLKIANAEELINAGQLATARSLLDEVEPKKDLLPAETQSRYEEARKRVAR